MNSIFSILHTRHKTQPLVKYGKWKHSTIDKVNIIIQSTKYIGRYSCLFNSTVDKIVMPTIIIAYELLISSQTTYSLANTMLLPPFVLFVTIFFIGATL